MIPETTISEETIFQGKLLQLRLRQAQLADETKVQREIIKTTGAVVIVPLTDKHEVRLLRQYRAAAEKWVYELPAGTLELGENPDVKPPPVNY